MAEENLEIVRETIRLANADELDGVRPFLHPDVVMWGPTDWPESGAMEGPDAVVRQYERLGEDYTQRRSEISDLTASGDWVVGRLRWHTRARHTGIETVLELWFVNRFEDGKIIEIRYFRDRDEALEAAGLREREGEPQWRGP